MGSVFVSEKEIMKRRTF